MKTKTLIALLITATLAGYANAANGPENANQGQQGIAQPATELTKVEEDNILLMREEEKLARDVYLTLAQLWDCPVFTRIAASEQRHMDAVGLLIARYGLVDSMVDDKIGVFSTTEFTQLFTDLTTSGAGSLLEALAVGVTIEEMDIEDLELALEETDKADIEWVFGNLLRGSTNHLRAFTRTIASGGTVCTLRARPGKTNGAAGQADDLGRQGRGRGGRGNRGRGENGTRNQDGIGQCDQQQRRDGSCQTEDAA